MNVNRMKLFEISFAFLIALSGCAGPDIYRPEVVIFKEATTEIESYIQATQISVGVIRKDLRADILENDSFDYDLSPECTKALVNLAKSAGEGTVPDLSAAANCRLLAGERNPELDKFQVNKAMTILFNPEDPFKNSAQFVASVATYSAALFKITEAGNKEEFVQAAKELGTAVIDLAGKAADATNSIMASKAAENNKTLPAEDLITKPDPNTFAPIANFAALSAFYGLEEKKTEALKAAAKEAHDWIEKGSEAVVDVMMSTQFEIASPRKLKLDEQIEVLQGAGEDTVVVEAIKTIENKNAYQAEINRDSAECFRKLPETHQKLLDAFNDRKRHFAAAIAIGQDLYQAARQAYDAVKMERDENKKE